MNTYVHMLAQVLPYHSFFCSATFFYSMNRILISPNFASFLVHKKIPVDYTVSLRLLRSIPHSFSFKPPPQQSVNAFPLILLPGEAESKIIE